MNGWQKMILLQYFVALLQCWDSSLQYTFHSRQNLSIKDWIYIKKTKEFNRKRKPYISTLEGYQRSLAEDKTDIYKVKINILNDINIINESFGTIFKINQKFVVWRLKRELEKSKSININRVCNLLSRIRAYMSNVIVE